MAPQGKGSNHLGPQLWVGRGANSRDALGPEHFNPVTHKYEDYPNVKPKGGLWTSTYHPEHGGGWVQWCIGEEFECDRNDPTWQNCWLLEPDPAARVFEIDTYDDLERLCDLYGHTDPERVGRHRSTYPDWARVAEDFDAVHLTDEGQWATRMTMPLDLYGWDCECTLWFRWAFTDARSLGPQTFKAADPWWEESIA